MSFKHLFISTIISAGLLSPSILHAAPQAGVSAPNSLKGKELTFVSYGGFYQDSQIAALQDFAKTTGAKVISGGPIEVAKVKAQVESGKVVWDVVDVGDNVPSSYCGTLFMKLDFSKIDTSQLPPGQIGECSVPSMNFGIVLMYRNDKYKDNPPKDWADFFDTKRFPGTRGLIGDSAVETSLLERAMIHAGADPKNLRPEDIEKGFEVLRQVRENAVFWQTGSQSQQMLEGGEVDMIAIWSGRGMLATKNGAKYTPVWKDWLLVMDQLAIPIGVKDPDAAHALINAYLGKRSQEIMTEASGYSPINIHAQPKLDPIAQDWLAIAPNRMATAYRQDLNFWSKNFQTANEQWAEFITGY